MKRILTVTFLIVLMFCLCFTLMACPLENNESTTSKSELSSAEKRFVGTWVLEDITYIDYGSVALGTSTTQLWYPSNSSIFNSLCEQYLNKTKLILEDTKKDNKLPAVLKVGNVETSFKWYVSESAAMIYFSESLSFSTFNGSSISSARTNKAMINSRGKLCINPNTNMIYIFVKK